MRVEGLGFGVWGLGSGVWGLRFGVVVFLCRDAQPQHRLSLSTWLYSLWLRAFGHHEGVALRLRV